MGQKLVTDNYDHSCVSDTDPTINQQPGGYTDGFGHAELRSWLTACSKPTRALASMITALKNQGLYDSTLFIVTAKHGQSPINPAKINKPGHFADLVAAVCRTVGAILLQSRSPMPIIVRRVRAVSCRTMTSRSSGCKDRECHRAAGYRLPEHQRYSAVHR